MKRLTPILFVGAGLLLSPLAGCENLPGTRETQGAAIGGVAGAATGAAVAGEGNRLLGALLGGAVGAGGGYLIGARTDWFGDPEADDEARKAVASAQRNPATAADVYRADTADLNGDGFVTLDEVLAMKDAGLSDAQMLDRLRATDQVFDLNASQRRELLEAGVSERVVAEMQEINRTQRDVILGR